MATWEELDKFLEDNSTDISWQYSESDNSLLLHSEQWDTTLKIDLNKLDKFTIEALKTMIMGGKNVAKITRVTGFFSNIASWNAGKRGELKDRFRITDGFSTTSNNDDEKSKSKRAERSEEA